MSDFILLDLWPLNSLILVDHPVLAIVEERVYPTGIPSFDN